ncbi:MAG: glycosyltransferase family 4 protein [Ilumatobacteraceae bacterium]
MDKRVGITVSGTIPADLSPSVDAGLRPRADYVVLADRLGADLIDHAEANRRAGPMAKVIQKVAGRNVLLAWTCFRSRKRYDAILTDGEQVGIPYAALCLVSRRRSRPAHSMIVHVMSVRKKVIVFKALGLRRRVDRMFVYASWQREFAIKRLRMPPEHVRLTSFMVDTAFFATERVMPAPRRMICAAGLEFRDYDTLVEAVRGLDVEVVIAAASPWSKRSSGVDGTLPPNVTVCKLNLFDLRQLYADALFVVVPLRATEFQAGVTTILEAMAMSRAVVCTKTSGQTDVIAHGETGLYVDPGDVRALRDAIRLLLDDPKEASRLGEAGRQWVVANADVSLYADRIAADVLADL